MTEALDRRFMAAAIRLGATANGTTWPNAAAVGAILVKDGLVIARGVTAPGGRPHAEAAALASAGAEAHGATLYASLEPCAHRGRRGGPCTDILIAAGVRRVAAAVVDPDDRTKEEGFRRLRAAGIEVVSGVLEAEAKRANPGHHMRQPGRPFVFLKLAVSADGAIGREGEAQVPVTGAIARRHAQALRSRFDAILVGSGTVAADDPSLTCRLPGLEHRSPVRVVLDSDGKLDADRKVFDGAAPTWVFSADEGAGRVGRGAATEPPPPEIRVGSAPPDFDLPARGRLSASSGPAEPGTRTFVVPRGEHGLNLDAVLRQLAAEGITQVLVEGGAKVARSLLEADLVDAVMLFRSPDKLGGAVVPALAGLPLDAIERSDRFRRVERRPFGRDMLSLYERIR